MKDWVSIQGRQIWARLSDPNREGLVAALLALALLLPIWWWAGRSYEAHLLRDERGQAAASLSPLGNTLTAAVNRRLARLDGLRALVEAELASAGRVRESQLMAFLPGLFSDASGIRNVLVAPGGVIRYVYPQTDNETLLGRDLIHDERPAVQADIQRAMQSGRISLSGPFELPQGGSILVAQHPIFRNGTFWGLVSMTLDVPPLVREAGLGTSLPGLALSLQDATGRLFYGQRPVLESGPVTQRVYLPDGWWVLSGVPISGWNSDIRRSLLAFRGGGLTVLLLLLILIHQTVNRTARLRAAVRERTQTLERDLAERRQVEEALGVSQAYFSSIVEISEDAIISVDAAHRITLFNQGAEKIFGCLRAEVLGKPLDVLLPRRFLDSHARHVESFASSPDILRPMNERGVVFGLRKDGTEFPAEASISKFEVRGERVLTVRLRDITERKRAEESLLQLAAIVESSDDAIIGKTLDGVILSWNSGAERLYGYSAREVKGRPISLLIPPEREGEMPRILERIRQGEKFTHLETVWVQKDGGRIDVSLSVSPIRDAAGRILGASTIARDITERKRLEAQIRQTQKMEAIGTLAGGIAHDFNNLLSAIIGHAELATDFVPRDGMAWQAIQGVLAAGGRAKDLVQQILTFSRQTEQERKPVPVHLIVKEALKLLRASLPTTVEFRQQVDPEAGMVLADSTQIHQILMNLCTNAEHAMREKGGVLDVRLMAVEVDTEYAASHPPLVPGPHVRLVVRDTGPGMEPKVRDRIFEPFFTTKGPGEGTGMGLAVVHGIVAGHGGKIAVDTAPGRGTKFEIYLPRCDVVQALETSPEEQARGGTDAPAPGQGERILIVDDEPYLAILWRVMLERLGYRVTGCSNSLEALEIFRAAPNSFDLVLTDQTMPHMTGAVLVKEVLRIRPETPIILCTGFSHAMTEEKARALGIRAFLLKPISRRDLSLAIRCVLDRRMPSAPQAAPGLVIVSGPAF
ncbi:MAG TPA: PAS domain S-box protein [Candidatus Methylomirabilis sp.]|nr:PAS domain S-box protein [Candidatus Methylomirabilis sp.]